MDQDCIVATLASVARRRHSKYCSPKLAARVAPNAKRRALRLHPVRCSTGSYSAFLTHSAVSGFKRHFSIRTPPSYGIQRSWWNVPAATPSRLAPRQCDVRRSEGSNGRVGLPGRVRAAATVCGTGIANLPPWIGTFGQACQQGEK